MTMYYVYGPAGYLKRFKITGRNVKTLREAEFTTNINKALPIDDDKEDTLGTIVNGLARWANAKKIAAGAYGIVLADWKDDND